MQSGFFVRMPDPEYCLPQAFRALLPMSRSISASGPGEAAPVPGPWRQPPVITPISCNAHCPMQLTARDQPVFLAFIACTRQPGRINFTLTISLCCRTCRIHRHLFCYRQKPFQARSYLRNSTNISTPLRHLIRSVTVSAGWGSRHRLCSMEWTGRGCCFPFPFR